MTTFTLSIDCDNAAFYENSPADELGILLRATAHKVELGDVSGKIFDTNGNRVGSFEIKS